MPVPTPPPGGDNAVPRERLYTSVKGHARDTHPDETHDTLRHLDDLMTRRGDRLTAIKLLRVMIMAIECPQDRSKLEWMLETYFNVYENPRLSTVATELGAFYPAVLKRHLNTDWFSGMESWWPKNQNGPLDGRGFELKVAKVLLPYLEHSMGRPLSSPCPTSWVWPDGSVSGENWKDDLIQEQPLPGDQQQMNPVVLEWEFRDDIGDLDVQVVGGAFRVITPPPVTRDVIDIL